MISAGKSTTKAPTQAPTPLHRPEPATTHFNGVYPLVVLKNKRWPLCIYFTTNTWPLLALIWEEKERLNFDLTTHPKCAPHTAKTPTTSVQCTQNSTSTSPTAFNTLYPPCAPQWEQLHNKNNNHAQVSESQQNITPQPPFTTQKCSTSSHSNYRGPPTPTTPAIVNRYCICAGQSCRVEMSSTFGNKTPINPTQIPTPVYILNCCKCHIMLSHTAS